MSLASVGVFTFSAADQGLCPDGFADSFNGYMSCAIASTPCATMLVLRSRVSRPSVVLAECVEACMGICKGVSLINSSECLIYHSWSGEHRYDANSVSCQMIAHRFQSSVRELTSSAETTDKHSAVFVVPWAAMNALVRAIPLLPLVAIVAFIGGGVVGLVLLLLGCAILRSRRRRSSQRFRGQRGGATAGRREVGGSAGGSGGVCVRDGHEGTQRGGQA